MHGTSREELTWIAGWDTVREIQNRRLGLVARAMKGKGTLKALWNDAALGATQGNGGVIGWLRREHRSLYGYPDPDWDSATLELPGEHVEVWDLKARPEDPVTSWMRAIGEAQEMVHTTAYTDGSKAPGGLVGAGVYTQGRKWYTTLNEDASVYDEEVEAIIQEIGSAGGRSMLILTDCQSVVKALQKATGEGVPIGGSVGRILGAAKGRIIKIAWVKAHIGIPGNCYEPQLHICLCLPCLCITVS